MTKKKDPKDLLPRGQPTKYQGEWTDKAVFEFASTHPVIDRQIAEFLNINIDTLHEWKKVHPSFSDSLNSAKEIIDSQIESALFKRARGYREKESKVFCHEGIIISEEFEKVYPPDPTSMIFWLKNRQRKNWRDRHEVDMDLKSVEKLSYQELLEKIEELKKEMEE